MDGETGFVVDPRSAAEVGDRICTLLANPEEAKAMGERGRTWVARKFSWDAAAATLTELLTIEA